VKRYVADGGDIWETKDGQRNKWLGRVDHWLAVVIVAHLNREMS
jgi:hypothetical protein